MNSIQLKHATSRARETFDRIKADLKKQFVTPAHTLSKQERIEALQRGEFRVDVKRRHYDWSDCIVFLDEHEAIESPKYDEAIRNATAAYGKVLDELVLGSASEALVLLSAFEKWKP